MFVFSKVLDNIMNNLTSPLESARDTAEKMAQVLRSTNFGLKELEEALKQAETSVNKTILINDGSEEVLSDIRVFKFVLYKVMNNKCHINIFSKLQFTVSCLQNHHMRFENKQDDILSNLAMIRGTLRGIEALQSMMNNLKNVSLVLLCIKVSFMSVFCIIHFIYNVHIIYISFLYKK